MCENAAKYVKEFNLQSLLFLATTYDFYVHWYVQLSWPNKSIGALFTHENYHGAKLYHKN